MGIGLATMLLVLVIGLETAWAANPSPQSGSIGVQGTISTAPPTRGATIAVPGNGAVFSTTPITISGLCQTGLLVKVFSNDIFVGSTLCANGSYSLQIDLFSRQNNLVVRVYDALDQAGPDSATVTVTFNDSQSLQFGTHISLSSNYAEYGAPPGTELDWPILLSGGIGPYAISVDWGDSSAQELLSTSNDGPITIKHVYKIAGTYNVIVKAVDKNGEAAFLQLVGQATGAVIHNGGKAAGNITVEKGSVAWWPALAMIPLIFATFWIGRRYEVQKLRKNYVGKFGATLDNSEK